MMQVLPIILVAVVMAVDGGLRPLGAGWNVPDWLGWTGLWAPPALALALCWAVVARCLRRLRRGRVAAPLMAAERTIRAARALIAVNFVVAVVALDGLGAVRRATGDLILVDELLTMLPALLALIATWWIFHPIERLLLDSVLVRRLDSGQPVYPAPSRWRYVLMQARMQVLLTLVPVLVIAGFSEVIDAAWARWRFGPVGVREAATIAMAAGVFLVSPLIARAVLDTQSIPPGPLRETLSDVCRRHRVGVRDLLLWNTNGSMINAAVMGLIAPLRFVLVTDALLETLRESEVRAVMAHEVGHVRRRHMAWMILCLFSCLCLAAYAIELPLRMAEERWPLPAAWMQAMAMTSMLAQLALGLLAFGWVCRRFERQADTFAAQHLSGLGTGAEASANVTMESVDAMRGALETIAELNTVDPARHSWRHGSIRWRQRYLDSIVGRPVLGLPIDRLVRGLKIVAAIVLIASLGYEFMASRAANAWKAPRRAIAAEAMNPRNHLNHRDEGLPRHGAAPLETEVRS